MAEPEASESETKPETEGQEPKVEGEEQEAEESPKKGYSTRVRELVKERNEERAKAQSLAEKLAQLTGSPNPNGNQPIAPVKDEPILAPGEEIDALELDRRLTERENRILQRADALATLRSRQSEVVNRINQEAGDAVRSFPELDPDSESFNKELSETVTEAVEAYVKADPYNASVKKFVGRLMKPYQAAVAKEVGQATETIAKQVTQTALRPTSVRKGEKAATEMSIEELERKLGVVVA